MELSLVNVEISESRLYRSSKSFGVFTGRDIANLMFLNTLALYVLYSLEDRNAKKYANKTAQHSSYLLYRTTATDLYMLGYQIRTPENKYVNLKNSTASEKFLDGLQFNDKNHIEFMREIASGQARPTKAFAYLNRLEKQLRISDSRYKQWRRDTANWHSLDRKSQKELIKNLAYEIQRTGGAAGKASELFTYLDKYKTSTAKKVAATAAGAVVGRELGNKIGKPKTGAALGAIAAYWASKK